MGHLQKRTKGDGTKEAPRKLVAMEQGLFVKKSRTLKILEETVVGGGLGQRESAQRREIQRGGEGVSNRAGPSVPDVRPTARCAPSWLMLSHSSLLC